jgi:beta-lactamase regulating signal transducer with metallopeptidase domain
MSGMETLWSIPGAGAVAWALVSFLWQGALVALALAGALSLVPSRSPRLRYALASGALLVMFLLSVATAWTFTPQRDSIGGHPDARDERKDLGGRSFPSPRSFRLVPRPQDDFALTTASRKLLEPWLPSLFAGWLAGVVLLSLWQIGGWAHLRRTARRDTRPVEEAWLARLGVLRERMRIGRAVALLESARVGVPTVIGWLSPVILVPASVFSGLTPRQLEAVLAHELAHVRRHDALINLLQTLVETLLFYHPAVWWVSRQVRVERESCCDDLALEVCGDCLDRLGYARALAALEELRAPAPRLALAATGGDLLERIRRLVGVTTPSASRPGAWLAGALAVALLLSAAAAHSARPSESATWKARREKDGRVWLQMEMRKVTANGRYEESHSDEIPEKDLIGLGAGPDVRFEMHHAAGTFVFTGRFPAGIGAQGEGRFTFQADPAYLREMASLSFAVQDENLIHLAMVDLSPAFAREIRNAGYTGLSLEELVRFQIHEVSADFIRQLADLGYRNLPVDDLVRLHIHGVDPALVRNLGALGLRNLSADDLVRLQIHGVTPDSIRKLADAGYRNLQADDLVRLQIHSVTPESIAELVRLGYRDVTPDDLVRMQIHGVDADFIRAQGRKSGRNLSVDELIRIKIHGS